MYATAVYPQGPIVLAIAKVRSTARERTQESCNLSGAAVLFLETETLLLFNFAFLRG